MLSYIHHKRGTSLWRCSEIRHKQMESDLIKDDVALLQLLTGSSGQLVVVSARDQQSREERQHGYESGKTYKNIEKQFYSLASRVKLVRSFEQVWQICNNISDKNFITQVLKTKWPLLIEEVLQRAFDIGQALSKDNVLIHCPSGDDGSAVLSSLVQIIMDPYYRTLKGF